MVNIVWRSHDFSLCLDQVLKVCFFLCILRLRRQSLEIQRWNYWFALLRAFVLSAR